MSYSHPPLDNDEINEDGDAMLDANEAAEEIPSDPDQRMDSDFEDAADVDADYEIQLENDSIGHFDTHTDSIFCIAQHPLDCSLVATGGGDDTAYVFSSSVTKPLLPPSYESNVSAARASISPIAKLTGHKDSVNAINFTLPSGAYLLTGGLDGQLRAYTVSDPQDHTISITFLTSALEVPEINFLTPCPHPLYPNTVALGASDGSVWVYTIEGAHLRVIQAYYLHTTSCTAGAWTPDGKLLATVSEDGSFYVWDVFEEAAAAGLGSKQGGQALVGLTNADQRFAIEGGLFSIAITPNGSFAAVGGAGGMIRIVGLPRISVANGSATQSQKGTGAKSKAAGGKKAGGVESAGQAGQILASLQAQTDGVETLSFSKSPLTLLAAGSVDGSIVLFDTAHRFAVRRNIKEAHEDFAVVRVEFGDGWDLTSCGMDGVVRKWDTRGGTAAAGGGLMKEWKGHKGEGEGGGVLGFVRGGGRIVTAGDDGVSLVFEDEI